MNQGGSFSQIEVRYVLGIFLLLVVALFINLGIYPLFLEEPRRGLIALEMLFNDNWWVPTQTGDLYFRKPPLYNWTLALSYRLFGEYSEFASRVVSVTSLIGMGISTFLFARKRLGFSIAVLSALGFLVSADILFYFSTLGEIDLFYSWITLLSFFALYHYGEKEKYSALFVVVYGLSALGLLTKGLSSIPFLGISLLCYFLYTRNFKKLFSLAHVWGILTFGLIVGGYFYMYSQYQDPSGWWTTLFEESAGRASNGGVWGFVKHLFEFPIENLKNLLPISLLIPVFFKRGLISTMKNQRLVWFFFWLFVTNFAIYWVSAEAKSRYVYALYPLIAIVFTYLASQGKTVSWHGKYWTVLTRVMLAMGTVLVPIVPFVSTFEVVDQRLWISIAVLLLFVGLWYLHLKRGVRPYLIIIGMAVVARLFFSMTIPVTRAETTGAAEDRTFAFDIAKTTEGQSLQRMGDVRMSLTIVYYLEAAREEVLRQTDEYKPGYFFCYTEDLPKTEYEQVAEFHYHQRPIFLIRIPD